ncbi:hypothetical protein ACMGGD_27560 [Pseudomonas sp. BNK-6]|uniref:hypothetical protein n=1 Tax=unclassified Pseudomonas TaxID=196821 RepID=UPI00273C9A02|nr:hypothetical protein [Pseudomonas sp. LPH60]MDP4573217.1 hypothetical protein [Pseudomonas sp. LPH60]
MYLLLARLFSFQSLHMQTLMIKKEIVDRCKSQMDKYGSVMVKACVDQDLEAVTGLKQIPDEHKNTVARCMKQMRKYGYSMVKECVDQDLEAAKALGEY